ncbi:uncharacterized protein MELLADRAFT_118316 [Melampsora larici-populina 98AG31]|uniref:BTB domain-containing protein n=1 Tax=Melampsora larici-populina (strain 98AG31 / pathotype 3-4-7) TaxID=747676 RepID=F4S7I4_MELLP|nr:uncharacterized protein MELLADRAFT_118316 [Melampsora larici-populina 98AG31]EGF99421.1 hypothetical protein MELLADRAFT_118316 [Melampsora larici-populina 98AG31]
MASSSTPSSSVPTASSSSRRSFQFPPNPLHQSYHPLSHHHSTLSSGSNNLFNHPSGSSWSHASPTRLHTPISHPLYRLPTSASRLSSIRQSAAQLSTPSHQPVLVPQPQQPSFLNPSLQLQSDWFDRPDSRSSSQSQSTALPSALNSLPPGSRPSKLSQPVPYKNFHVWTEEWPRQWGWTGVDIPVHNVKALRDEIENVGFPNSELELPHDASTAEVTVGDEVAGSGEVVSCSFASNKWKVEVIKGHSRRPSAPTTPTSRLANVTSIPATSPSPSSGDLSLYLTCHELEVDWPTSRSISTSIIVSIKEPRIPVNLNPITDLGSASEGWIWRVCCEERSFERESEVWECHTFPSLSKILENPRVAMYDSFIITIQIATPSTVSLPQIPNSSYIPHTLLQGLESLVDDQNTSDLQILVTEYDPSLSLTSSDHPVPPRHRKRVLYAHSAILKSRSEYFRAMLGDDEQGGWAEGGTSRGENRKLGLVKIEDFDFNCVYWLLRWLYSNRIFFVDQEDVRTECFLGSSLTQAAYPSSDDMLPHSWNWRTYGEADEGEHSVAEAETTAESITSDDLLETVSESGINSSVHGTPRVAIASSTAASASGRGRPRGGSTTASASSAGKRRTTSTTTGFPGPLSPLVPQSPSHGLHNRSAGSSGTRAPSSRDAVGASRASSGSFSRSTHHTNPNADPSSRSRSTEVTVPPSSDGAWLIGEPHSHPVAVPSKASALSIYRLAHRYELTNLQELAMTHLVANLTPSTAFPLLLASFVFPELHTEIKAYCLAHYHEIVHEPEFSRCYAEVGEGLWEHGGEVLLSFTMSLMPGPPNGSWY